MRRNVAWASLGPLLGQNSSDNPLSLGEGWATSTRNVTINPQSSVAAKRHGSTAFAFPAGTSNIVRHLPKNTSDASAELWAFTDTGIAFNAYQKIGAGAFTLIGPATMSRAVSFNGKLFVAGSNGTAGTNRLWCWDGSAYRTVGLIAAQAAPTVANTGAGAYAAVARYYKVDFVRLDATTSATVSRSELSPVSTVFTPSGAGTAARVTKPANDALDTPTHWRVWASTTETGFYRKISGNIAIATTTYDDSVAPAAYVGDFPELVGTFLPPPGCSLIITDGHRLLMAEPNVPNYFGGTPPAGTTVQLPYRVWYTPVLGSLDQGDDERIPQTSAQKNFLDVGDAAMGVVTELIGPMDGHIFVFNQHRTWRLVPTGDLVTPYLTYPVSSVYGCPLGLFSPSAAVGEVDNGQPAIYFVDAVAGMYRITSGEDVQCVSYDIQNEVNALRDRQLTYGPTQMIVFTWPEMKQTWWTIPLQDPSEIRIYVFHWRSGTVDRGVVRGGWTTWQHAEGAGVSVGHESNFITDIILHNRVPGGTGADDQALIPYACIRGNGTSGGVTVPSNGYTFDRPTGKDGDARYAASVTAAPILPGGGQYVMRVGNPTVVATALPAVSLRVSATRDFGTETRYADVSLQPVGEETNVVRTVEGLFQGDLTSLAITIGDAEPSEALWHIDFVTVPTGRQESR